MSSVTRLEILERSKATLEEECRKLFEIIQDQGRLLEDCHSLIRQQERAIKHLEEVAQSIK